MDCCGQRFTQEICKFRFLNEMIRLVSKQHDGDKTPKEIQTKILDIMFTWTTKYPAESKIKEAYDMLKTQGIIHEPTKNVMIGGQADHVLPPMRPMDRNTSRMDPRHVMLKKLINSKNKEDILKANLLIQNMCREDERRLQIKGRRLVESHRASESATVLDEMLEFYSKGTASADDLQVINELQTRCELYQPTLLKLINETEEKDDSLGTILQVNDHLMAVQDKYRRIVVRGERDPTSTNMSTTSRNSDLLQDILGLGKPTGTDTTEGATVTSSSNVMDVFGDIFSKPVTDGATASGATALKDLLVPQKLKTEVPVTSRYDALLNLNKLAQNGPNMATKLPPKISAVGPPKKFGLDLDSLVDGMKTKLLPQSSVEEPDVPIANADDDEAMLVNTPIVDLTTNKQQNGDNKPAIASDLIEEKPKSAVPSFKSLAEIHIDLDSIQPSSEPARSVLDEDKGLKIMLNFARDRPRDDVLVAVISTINYGSQAVYNFHFDASVPKPCKLRLLPASATGLPAAKPFRPPADSIFQLLLIANPTQQAISKITCIFSYCLGDDPDPIKESVEVKELPYKVD